MASNQFLPFCPTDTGTNLLTNADYLAATDRDIGNQPGIASSKLNNKAVRQASAMSAGLGGLIASITGADALDDGDNGRLLAQLRALMGAYPPNLNKMTSSSGTYNLAYLFFLQSGNATAGATYTNNSITYTVVTTIASGTVLKATGNGAPTASGTLTKTSGTGDATINFFAFRKPVYLKVAMVGGGGGGSGGGGSSGAGGTGGDTTWGTSTAGGGAGASGATFGSGGGATLGSGHVGFGVNGQNGSGGEYANFTNSKAIGGMGGPSALGGAGIYSTNTDGTAAKTNSGSGGGGGAGDSASSSSVYGGAGGGSGAFLNFTIAAPAATYAWTVGALGAGSAGIASAGAGGNGAAGQIVVEEHYQ